jgi:hypothetical protein
MHDNVVVDAHGNIPELKAGRSCRIEELRAIVIAKVRSRYALEMLAGCCRCT